MSGRSPISSLGALAASLWFSEFSICRTAPAEFFLLQLKRGKNLKMDTADIKGSAFNNQQFKLKNHYILGIKIVDSWTPLATSMCIFSWHTIRVISIFAIHFRKFISTITSLYLKILNINFQKSPSKLSLMNITCLGPFFPS